MWQKSSVLDVFAEGHKSRRQPQTTPARIPACLTHLPEDAKIKDTSTWERTGDCGHKACEKAKHYR